MPKNNKINEQIMELTSDLQRTRADFENYRKRVETEKTQARENGQVSMIMKLIPVIDNIDRAISHVPENLMADNWVQGVTGLSKNLEKAMQEIGISKVPAEVGMEFDPNLHDAIQFDEDASGTKEVISEVLQSGYSLGGTPIRHAMVKVTKK